jgi:hypothetical protein
MKDFNTNSIQKRRENTNQKESNGGNFYKQESI